MKENLLYSNKLDCYNSVCFLGSWNIERSTGNYKRKNERVINSQDSNKVVQDGKHSTLYGSAVDPVFLSCSLKYEILK